MPHHSTEVVVRYGETDKMGVAHHSSYLLWFELGRTGLLRQAGHPYRELERDGFQLPVVEYSCRFYVGAEYDDTLIIETRVSELKSRTVAFRYRAVRDGRLLATGRTRHICVTPNNRVQRIPDSVRDELAFFLSPPSA